MSNEKKLANKSVGNNNIDKRFKEEKKMIRETGILIDSHTEENTDMDEKNGSTKELSLKCPVPGCKFGFLPKIMINTKLY